MPSSLDTMGVDESQSAVPLVVPGTNAEYADEQDKLFDYQASRTLLKRLIDDWITENTDTEVRRKERKSEIDVEGLRQKNDLDEDETIVPIRIIDTNIGREQPQYVNYLKNSRRIAIFDCLDDPELDCDLLEQAFTKVCTYTAWEVPHFKALDGAMLHGWDAVEVVRDLDKPGNFSIEQIGHDKLFYPRSAIDLQKCPRIIRAYDVSLLQLQDFVKKYNFDAEQVNRIRAAAKDTHKEGETKRIHKIFFKKDGVVHVAWFTLTDGVDDWLMKPVKFYCGIDDPQTGQPVDVKLYPVFILPYRHTEEAKIADAKGRGFLDTFKQEAYTALWSAFINGMTRASAIYGSPAQEDGTGSSLKELEDIKMTPGRFMSRPVNFFSPPYPDPMVLKALQYAEVSNSDETGQVNFAAMNRIDSRKTAKEIGAAEQQQSLMNSVQLTLFSTFIRQVYSFVWLIVQSQAIQGEIKFLLVKTQHPVPNPITGQPQIDPQTGQPMIQDVWVNDIATLSHIYSVRAAGDVDVIQKQDMIQKMQQDMQLAMQTPLKDQFIMDYFKLKYPESADRYSKLLGQTGQMQMMTGLIGQLSTVLEGVFKDHPDELTALPQQQQHDVATMIQQAKAITGQPQGAPQNA